MSNRKKNHFLIAAMLDKYLDFVVGFNVLKLLNVLVTIPDANGLNGPQNNVIR